MTGQRAAAVRLIEEGEISPLRSQALYHGLALAMSETSPDTVVLCRPGAPYFCVGFHQSPRAELDLEWCRRRGYPVIQRRIGGGTVFVDSRQLFYQCIVHRRRAPFAVEAIYRRFLTPVVQALRALGLAARLEGINEIEVDGRRIAGTGGGQIGEAVVVVGNLLFDFPPAVMGRAWRVPSRAFRRLAEEGLRLHLATLDAVLGRRPSEAEIRRRLIAEYEAELDRPLTPGLFTREEEAAVATEADRLARLDEKEGLMRPRRGRLKVTRRVWVQQWRWAVEGGEATVTARLADGQVEEMDVAGAALTSDEARRRIAEALVEGARA